MLEKVDEIARKFGIDPEMAWGIYLFMDDVMDDEDYARPELLALDARRTEQVKGEPEDEFFDELARVYFDEMI